MFPENITITEALYSTAIATGNYDETNIIPAVRHAQQTIQNYLDSPVETLHTPRPITEIDDLLIIVTQNGHLDIFT